MFVLFIVMMCTAVYGISAAPAVILAKPLAEQNDVKSASSELPGITNLGEKSLPAIELQAPDADSSIATHPSSSTALQGIRNNAERIQVQPPSYFRGNQNLAEKSIPETVIARINESYRSQSESDS